MNYVLHHRIPYYIGTSFEILSMYSLIVYYELITFPCVILIYVLLMNCIHKLQLFVFYCQDTFCTVPIVILMTSSISTLVDLWNIE